VLYLTFTPRYSRKIPRWHQINHHSPWTCCLTGYLWLGKVLGPRPSPTFSRSKPSCVTKAPSTTAPLAPGPQCVTSPHIKNSNSLGASISKFLFFSCRAPIFQNPHHGYHTFTSSKHREQAHWFLKRSAERKPLRICTFPFSGGYSVPTYIDIHIFFPSRYVFMNASAGPNLNVSAKGKKNQRYFTPFFGREVCDSYFFCLSKSLIFLSPGSVWLIISGAECVWSLTNKPTDPPSLSLSPSL
jgi:hypothetical protein